MNYINCFFAIILGYIWGAIPWGLILSKGLANVDISKHGSKNIGSTNVFRTIGIKYAIFVYILDMLKGFIPYFLAKYYEYDNMGLVISFFAVIGHCYSPFINFKGGKGVATASGIILAINYKIFIVLIIIQFIMLYTIKIMSICSITTSILFPVFIYFVYGTGLKFYTAILIGIFVTFKHKQNIKKIINRNENKLI